MSKNAAFSKAEKALADAEAKFSFTKATNEYKMLQSLMENGKITPSDKPGDVRKAYDDFNKIPMDRFRSQFNKLKQLTGLHTREGTEENIHYSTRDVLVINNAAHPNYFYVAKPSSAKRRQLHGSTP
jgi:hypothetical protein